MRAAYRLNFLALTFCASALVMPSPATPNVLGADPSNPSQQGARVVTWHGYQKAIELTNDHVRVVLCPEVGGRVLEYSLDGVNALYVSEDEKSWKPGNQPPSSAGRFDIGPELVIPERPILWSGEWTGKIIGPRKARLESQPDPAVGVRLVREFELDAEGTHLSCAQTIINVSSETKEWCHWSRTFAVGKGICWIPISEPSRFPNHYVMYEEGSLINMRPEDPNIRIRDGFLEILAAPRKPKLGFDSSAGRIAYLAPNNLLFVKRFKTDRDRVFNEAAGLTISVWYPQGDMIELEPIGPRESLKPGESATYIEDWTLTQTNLWPKSNTPVDLEALKTHLGAESH